MRLYRWLLAFVLVAPLLSAQTVKVAATPPMGWNSWNYFADKVDDKAVRDAADALVATGMRDAGYIYVNIDDTWQGERDAQGVLQPNKKFPDMKGLADYVHSKAQDRHIFRSGTEDLRRQRGVISTKSRMPRHTPSKASIT